MTTNGQRRIFIDVTRTHDTPLHSGIQKVVRGLCRALGGLEETHDISVTPVTLDGAEAVALDHLPYHPFELAGSAAPNGASVIRLEDPLLTRLRVGFRNLSQTNRAAAVLYPLARRLSRLARTARTRLRPRVGPDATGSKVGFRPGDILLMPDASWQVDPWPAVDRAKAEGAEIVMIWHDAIPLTHPQHFHPELVGEFERYFHDALKRADRMIAVSHATADATRRAARAQGLTAPPMTRVWPGVERAPPARRRGAIQRILERPTAVIVATIEPRKGHATLLDAADRLWRQGIPFNLAIVGRPGWNVAQLMKRIASHQKAGTALFHLTDLSDGEISDLLDQAALLAMPSIAEGYGLPIVEAELAGCPVICSDIPVFREIAGPAARFVRPGCDTALASAMAPVLISHRPGERTPLRDRDEAGFKRYAREILAYLDCPNGGGKALKRGRARRVQEGRVRA